MKNVSTHWRSPQMAVLSVVRQTTKQCVYMTRKVATGSQFLKAIERVSGLVHFPQSIN